MSSVFCAFLTTLPNNASLSSFDVIFTFFCKNDYVRLVVVLEQRLGVVFGGVTSTTTTHQESQRRKDKSATLVVDGTNTTFPKSSRGGTTSHESSFDDDDALTDDDDTDVNNFDFHDDATTTTTTTNNSGGSNSSNRREFLNRGASVVVAFETMMMMMSFPRSASAFGIGFQKELKKPSRRASLNDLTTHISPTFQFRGEEHAGVEYGDARIGNGNEIKAGALTTIHFDVKLRGLTVLSTRTVRTLGGNRTVSEPMQFLYGKLPTEFSKPLKRKTVNGIGAEVRIDPELGELYVVKVSPDILFGKAGFKSERRDFRDRWDEGFGEFTDSRDWRFVDRTSGYDCGRDSKKRWDSRGPDAPVEKYTLTREATAIVPKKRVF